MAASYVSTRGAAPELGFGDVLLAGLASDGGLYVPEETAVAIRDSLIFPGVTVRTSVDLRRVVITSSDVIECR